MGQSKAFLDFQQKLSSVARIDRPVLIIGERGSGKELAAGRLHYLSRRWDSPFVALNCSALNPNLIETELFGHEAGAFTGAEKVRHGRFEEAHGGTLFLDEIGLIPLVVQEKILRVVEYGEFERVGSSRSREADVRIIGATSADLPALCEEGFFKADLLDRLSFEVLFLPPLRHRGEDILMLARHFATRMARETGKPESMAFSDAAIRQLQHHSWPGNIRELKNAVERAVYLATDEEINSLVLDPFRNPFSDPQEPPSPPQRHKAKTVEDITPPLDLAGFSEARARLEAVYLSEALNRSHYNQKQAAQLLNISYDQLRGLYRRHASQIKT